MFGIAVTREVLEAICGIGKLMLLNDENRIKQKFDDEILEIQKMEDGYKIVMYPDKDKGLEELECKMESRRKENLQNLSQLTLGELIEQLEKIPNKDLPVIFNSCYCPTGLSSWRGVYGELAIEYDTVGGVSLSEFLEMLKGAIGKIYEGYKGGSYVMRSDTPLWVANYGMTQGFRRNEDGDYQAVSGVQWCDRYAIILTDCLGY